MSEHLKGRAGVVPILIVVMLASLAVPQAITKFAETIGVDFYNFWGVPVARRLTGATLGTPYSQGEHYQTALKQYATTVNQPRLHAVQRFWSAPDYTGSPLLYQAFGLVSDDYTLALAVFRGLQILAFLGACVLLGRLYLFDPFYLLCFALISLLLYQPLLSDLRVANLGCLQLAVLAAVTGLASALPRVPAVAWRAGLAAVVLIALAALTLCKPNIALVSVLLAVHLAVRHGAGLFVRAAVPAVVVTALLIVAPCLYFGSWTVWQEWFRFVYGANPGMLVRPIASGNYSTPLFVSTWTGASVSLIAAVLLVLLLASLVVIRRPDPQSRAARPALETVLATFKRLFSEPHAAVAIGILITTAASPLFWLHYYVLLVIPSLWLLSASGAWRAVPLLAAIGVVLSAGILGMPLWALGWPSAMPATIALSWIPLWGALLLGLRSPDAPVEALTTDGRASRSRRSRK
jgi:hypothetical protein